MQPKKNKDELRLSLEASLRRNSSDGTWRVGDMLPTVRELAQQYQVSSRVINQELSKLIDEGIIYTVPRVGTFVGSPFVSKPDFYLMLQPYYSFQGAASREEPLRIGFEERVAQNGDSSLVLPVETALELLNKGDLPPLAGVFDYSYNPGIEVEWKTQPGVPMVGFSTKETPERIRDNEHTDMVFFNDTEGGRLATQHLIQQGHRRIAYLGFHLPHQAAGPYIWSARRALGWKDIMTRFGQMTDDLIMLPDELPENHDYELQNALEVAKRLVHRRDITAVVAANDYAAMGICEALQQAQIPPAHWPSIVGFDGHSEARNYVITSLRLPWEEVGRLAADLLRERKHGKLVGPPQERQVRMRLGSRLTSRRDWGQSMSGALLATLSNR